MTNGLYYSIFNTMKSGRESGSLNVRVSDQLSADMQSFTISSGLLRTQNQQLQATTKSCYEDFKNSLKNIDVEDGEGYDSRFDATQFLTRSQINAGFLAFGAGYTSESINSQLNPHAPTLPNGFKGTQAEGTYRDNFDVSQIAPVQESFDGASKESSLYLTMVVSMATAKQEDFVEAFCPTVVVKPDEYGMYVTVKYPSYVKDYVMDRSNAKLVDETMNRLPIVKNIYNPEVMGQDRTLIVPSWTGAGEGNSKDAEQWMVADVEVNNTERGQTIKSGYYKLGTALNILQLGQTGADIARNGVADITDNVLPGVMMKQLLVEIQPKSAAASAKIPFDLSGCHGKAFGNLQQGHIKDINMQMSNQEVAIELGSVKDYLGADVKFTGCTEATGKAGYKLIFSLTMAGQGNLQTGSFTVNCIEMKLKDVRDQHGQSLGLEHETVQGLVKAFTVEAVKFEPLGYTMIAYRANTNLRTSGQLIQSDGFAYLYPVNFKSPWRLQGPVSNYTGTETDFEEVNNAIASITYKANYAGVQKILGFADQVKQEYSIFGGSKKNPTEDYNSVLVNPYYKEKQIDLSGLVDSLNSSNRLSDLRSALHNALRQDVLEMITKSNYKVAFDNVYGEQKKKMVVIVATHFNLAQYFCNQLDNGEYTDTFALTDAITCKVVSTMNPALIDHEGKYQVLFTMSTTDNIGSITSVQKLHPGFRLFSNVVTVTLNGVIEQGAAKTITQLIPKYEHHLTMKIMGRYKVSGIEKVLEKLPVKMQPTE